MYVLLTYYWKTSWVAKKRGERLEQNWWVCVPHRPLLKPKSATGYYCIGLEARALHDFGHKFGA